MSADVTSPPVDRTNFFFSARRIITGLGCLGQLPGEVHRLGAERVLVITDQGVRKAGVADQVLARLDAKMPFTVFDAIRPNPTVDDVMAGVAAVGDPRGVVIVAVGGGSVLDAAKMIGAMAVNGGRVQDYDGVDKIPKRMLPLIAVNTTAGTGSDVTRWAVITDHDRHLKMAIGDENIMPDVALDDPILTVGLPPAITAGTGMDAFTHALEGYVGRFNSPLTDGMAVAAMQVIAANLKLAYDEPGDLMARENMLYAQIAAGLAFENAGVGNVHAMAHQLGGLYDMPHGLSNAILLPYVMEYNLPACERKFATVAAILGEDTAGLSDKQAAARAVGAVLRLNREVGIPSSLAGTPADRTDIPTLVNQALKDLGAGTNPITSTEEEMTRLWTCAFDGDLVTA
jgi:alcohol dehydrogenase